jgi:hypothetical protein
MDHHVNWLRFAYVLIFSRSHDLPPHLYNARPHSPAENTPEASAAAARAAACARSTVSDRGWPPPPETWFARLPPRAPSSTCPKRSR